MLFQIEPNKDVFKTNPEALIYEEFKHMTSKMFKCLILFADYKSPLRQKPKDDRFRLAAMQAGYKVDSSHHEQLEKRARELFSEDNKYWNAGFAKYMEIQHDEDRESLEMVEAQINNIRDVLKVSIKAEDEKAEDTLLRRTKLITSLPELLKTKREIARILDIELTVMGDSTEGDVEGEPRKLSLVDKINMENQKDDE